MLIRDLERRDWPQWCALWRGCNDRVAGVTPFIKYSRGAQ